MSMKDVRLRDGRRAGEAMGTSKATQTDTGNGSPTLTPTDVQRLFEDGYRDIEILPDGTIREATRKGDVVDETVTRTLKTERTWY
jgi:hypothetical protein